MLFYICTDSAFPIFNLKPNQVYFHRLWITSKDESSAPEPQQLGYYNVVPACVSDGFFSKIKFESFDVTIEKLNDIFRRCPLPGK